jgi:hypothetical protein
MNFASFEFAIFIVITVVLFRICPRRWQAAFILIASYVFYCTWDALMAVALFVATLLAYVVAIQLEKFRGRQTASRLMLAAVSALVLYLAFFKAKTFLRLGGGPLIPLGISYYTFRLISYIVDVYWGKLEAERSFVPFAAYVAFFPHMIAGPIQRASSFLPQIDQPSEPRVLEGLVRMMLGFFKKALIADNLALFVDYGYRHLHSGSAVPNLISIYVYPVQLYADFSGLTDIAIGIGLFFGIEAPENFDAPFSAANISEFWRRWHMTLTNWLRDYVFMPLRMATRNWGRYGLALSVMTTMVLIGIWHGFTVAFLAFGILHGVFLTVDALTTQWRKQLYQRRPVALTVACVLGPILTYTLVSLGDTLFRAPSFRDAAELLSGLTVGLAHPAGVFAALAAPPNHYAWVALPAFILTELVDYVRRHWGLQLPDSAPRAIRWAACTCTATCCVFVVLLLLARQTEANPFVYANF